MGEKIEELGYVVRWLYGLWKVWWRYEDVGCGLGKRKGGIEMMGGFEGGEGGGKAKKGRKGGCNLKH